MDKSLMRRNAIGLLLVPGMLLIMLSSAASPAEAAVKNFDYNAPGILMAGQWTDNSGTYRKPVCAGPITLTATGSTLAITVWQAGSYMVSVDGGAFAPLLTTGAGAMGVTSVYANLTDAPHTVLIVPPANTYINNSPAFTLTGAAPSISAHPSFGVQKSFNSPDWNNFGTFGGAPSTDITGFCGTDATSTTRIWSKSGAYGTMGGPASINFATTGLQGGVGIMAFSSNDGNQEFVLYEDGVQKGPSVTLSGSGNQFVQLAASLPNGPHKYSIVNIASSASTLIYGGVLLGGGAGLTPVTARPDMFLTGDSIVQCRNAGAVTDDTQCIGYSSAVALNIGLRQSGNYGDLVTSPGTLASTTTIGNIMAGATPTFRMGTLEGGTNDKGISEPIGDCATAGTFTYSYIQMLTNYSSYMVSGSILYALGILPNSNPGDNTTYRAAEKTAVTCFNALSTSSRNNVTAIYIPTDTWIDGTVNGPNLLGPVHPNVAGYSLINNRLTPLWAGNPNVLGTSYTLTGPTAGPSRLPTPPFTITMPGSPAATFTGDLRLTCSSTNAADVFSVAQPMSPPVGASSVLFTVTPSGGGARTISCSSNQAGWVNPAAIAYTSHATPRISNFSIVPDTNGVLAKYDVTPQPAYTITGATWSGGYTTFTIGPHTIQVNDYLTVASATPDTYNNFTLINPGSQVTAITPTTITVYGPGSDPGAYASGGAITVSPYCWVQYGVASGTYLWSSYTYSLAEFPNGYSSSCSVPITGLQEGATYYFLPTARPNADDEADICNNSPCGATEQVATTAAASVSRLPATPAPVASTLLSEPDTTGYVTIPLVDGGAGVQHECVAGPGTYSVPAGYPAGAPKVAAGQTLTTIMANKAMLYGMVFQIAQGTACQVPTTFAPYGTGYALPLVPVDPLATGGSVDAPNHRWIIFRSAPGSSTDFPPFGKRTGPSFFSHYGGFQAIHPSQYPSYGTGSLFSGYGGQAHHLWFENLKFSVDETKTSANYSYFFVLGNGEGGGAAPFPSYIVFRGNYFHGPYRSNIRNGTPSVQGAIYGTVNGQLAIAGNYFDNLYYAGGALGAGIVQALTFGDCGNLGTCGTGGPALIDNNYFHGMAMNLYVEQTNFTHTPAHDFTITHNYLYYPYETYTWASDRTAFPYGFACRNQFEFKGMSRARLAGNYVNGAWACANTGIPFLFIGFNSDLTIKSNIVSNAPGMFALGGLFPHAPGPVGATGNRYLIANNLGYNLSRLQSGNYQAGGGGLVAPILEIDSAVNNITMVNNTITPVETGNWFYPYIVSNSGGPTGQIAGLTMKNNVLPFSLANTAYAGGIGTSANQITGPGMMSHPSTPGVFSLAGSGADFTAALRVNSGYTANTAGLGMQGISVISGGSGYPNSGNLVFSGCTALPTGTFTAIGGVIRSSADLYGNPIGATNLTSTGYGCNPATMTVIADISGGGSGAILRPHYGLTPAYSWGGNVNVCTSSNGTEMSAANCTALSATMPSGDVYASGSSTANRMAAAGVTANYGVVPGASNPGNAGANLNQLYSDTGTVTGVQVAVSSSAFQISYTAPDYNSCSLDVGSAASGWTRTADSGGVRSRKLAVTGLTPGANYNYRLLCYFEQASPLFSADQITDGDFSTLITATGNPSFPFRLTSVPNATSFKTTLTGVDGGIYSQTCTSSPCVISNVPLGDYSSVRQWLKGSTVIASSDLQPLSVR